MVCGSWWMALLWRDWNFFFSPRFEFLYVIKQILSTFIYIINWKNIKLKGEGLNFFFFLNWNYEDKNKKDNT